MLSLVIYLKTKLICVEEIVIYEKFIQTIVHNIFKNFGKKQKNRNCSVVVNIFFITFFQNWNNFCDLQFFREDCIFKRCFKNFEENHLHRIVDSIIILPLRPLQPITLFCSSLSIVFSNYWKENSLCPIEALHWGKYSLTSLVTTAILLAKAVPLLVKYFLNSFAILLSFSVIPCLVFMAFGKN